jgi:uncharacterized lipoprotein YmbA
MKTPDFPSRAFVVSAAGLAALLGLGLAGCFSLEPTSDNVRYYTLGTLDGGDRPASIPAAEAPRVGVVVTGIAPHLKRSPIAVRTGPHEIRFVETHRWADHLDVAIGHELAAGLQHRLGSRVAVASVGAVEAASLDIVVQVDLLACEGSTTTATGATGAGAAVFSADWRVLSGRGAGRRTVAAGRFFRETPGWDGADHGRLAAMLRAAIDEMSDSLAGQVTAATASAVAVDAKGVSAE